MASIPQQAAAHKAATNKDLIPRPPLELGTSVQSDPNFAKQSRLPQNLSPSIALREKQERDSFVVFTRDNNHPDPFGTHSETTGPLPWRTVRSKYCDKYPPEVTVQAVQKQYRKDEKWFAANPKYPTTIIYTGLRSIKKNRKDKMGKWRKKRKSAPTRSESVWEKTHVESSPGSKPSHEPQGDIDFDASDEEQAEPSSNVPDDDRDAIAASFKRRRVMTKEEEIDNDIWASKQERAEIRREYFAKRDMDTEYDAPRWCDENYFDEFWAYLENDITTDEESLVAAALNRLLDEFIPVHRMYTLRKTAKYMRSYHRYYTGVFADPLRTIPSDMNAEFVTLTATEVHKKHQGSHQIPTWIINKHSDFVYDHLKYHVNLEITLVGVELRVIHGYAQLCCDVPQELAKYEVPNTNYLRYPDLDWPLHYMVQVYCLAAELKDWFVTYNIWKHWQAIDTEELEIDEKHLNMIWYRTEPGDRARRLWSKVLYRNKYAWWIVEMGKEPGRFHSSLVANLKRSLRRRWGRHKKIKTVYEYHDFRESEPQRYCLHEDKGKETEIEAGAIFDGLCKECKTKLSQYDADNPEAPSS